MLNLCLFCLFYLAPFKSNHKHSGRTHGPIIFCMSVCMRPADIEACFMYGCSKVVCGCFWVVVVLFVVLCVWRLVVALLAVYCWLAAVF